MDIEDLPWALHRRLGRPVSPTTTGSPCPSRRRRGSGYELLDGELLVSLTSRRRTDVLRKRRAYERAGVPEFWFVDLDADQFQRYVLGEDGTYGAPTVVLDDGDLHATPLPGFTMPAATALALGRPE